MPEQVRVLVDFSHSRHQGRAEKGRDPLLEPPDRYAPDEVLRELRHRHYDFVVLPSGSLESHVMGPHAAPLYRDTNFAVYAVVVGEDEDLAVGVLRAEVARGTWAGMRLIERESAAQWRRHWRDSAIIHHDHLAAVAGIIQRGNRPEACFQLSRAVVCADNDQEPKARRHRHDSITITAKQTLYNEQGRRR
jgi:hypothetical protein